MLLYRTHTNQDSTHLKCCQLRKSSEGKTNKFSAANLDNNRTHAKAVKAEFLHIQNFCSIKYLQLTEDTACTKIKGKWELDIASNNKGLPNSPTTRSPLEKR